MYSILITDTGGFKWVWWSIDHIIVPVVTLNTSSPVGDGVGGVKKFYGGEHPMWEG